jgi:hypothetical protein
MMKTWTCSTFTGHWPVQKIDVSYVAELARLAAIKQNPDSYQYFKDEWFE